MVGTGVDPVTSRFSDRISRFGGLVSTHEKSANSLINDYSRAVVSWSLDCAVSRCFSFVGARLGHEASPRSINGPDVKMADGVSRSDTNWRGTRRLSQ